MASIMKSLMESDELYVKAFQLYLERCSQHQSMKNFINGTLSDILASVGEGKDKLNIIGVGSAAGEMDMELISQLRQKHPSITVDNQVIEPSSEQLDNYKVLVSTRPDLDYIKFTWNNMTAFEFEQHFQEEKTSKKADFIHMLQVLYHINDPGAAISFYQSLLSKTGKLLITLVSSKSGREKLWRTYKGQLASTNTRQYLTMNDIKSMLDSRGIGYRSYQVPLYLDISECFVEGNENGELLVDFVTQVLDFRGTAPADLQAGVLEMLRHPDCSVETDGKVLFNNSIEALVLDPVP